MKIIINEKYFIEVDNYNHALKENTGNLGKKGNVIVKTHGYFQSVASCLKRLASLEVIESKQSMTLGQYIQALEEITNKLIHAVKV